MMATDRERVLELFSAALDMPPAEQSVYLGNAAAHQPTIVAEVLSLLDVDRQADEAGFLNSSAWQVGAEHLAHEIGDERVGGRIGPFRVLNLIGTGGMGAIYLAERDDDQYHRRVAIKVIKRGMDTDYVLQRFRNERQILANLNHPNIARFYSGEATADGLPYFVMEFIDGVPITQYADGHQLSVNERLKLFRKVCGAVQYAHQNLIVHRDLKPTNILVTAEGEPKLLDFGIAKLLDPSAPERTLTMFRAMTPDYASPEQIRGEGVTTATDVYSLGVILYELLIGRRPFTKPTPQAITKAICEEEPAKPSAARASRESGVVGRGSNSTVTESSSAINPKLLRGDLDNIALMALRKEPPRRYSSVAAFSEDIQRYLDGRPVAARKDTAWYRTSKFVGRHRLGVAAALTVLVTLLGGIIGTAWQAHAARVERVRAERRFQDVRKLAHSFMFEFHDAIKDLPGALNARQLVVKRALEYLDSLAQEAGGDRALQSELALAYEKVGSLTFDVRQTIESHRKAMLLNESLVSADPQNLTYRQQLSQSYSQMSDSMKIAGHSAAAIEYATKSLSIVERLWLEHPNDLTVKADLADRFLTLGIALEDAGQSQPALDNDRKALLLQQEIAGLDPENKERLADLSVIESQLSKALAGSGQYAAAIEYNDKSFAMTRNLFQAEPASGRFRRAMWAGYLRTGRLRLNAGEERAAVEDCARALQVLDKLASADPKDTGHLVWLAVTYQTYGDALTAAAQTRNALSNYQKAISIGEGLVAADAARAEARNNLATAYASLGRLLQHRGDRAAATANLNRAAALYGQSLQEDPQNERIRAESAKVEDSLKATSSSGPQLRGN